MTPTHLEHLNPQTAQTTSLLNILWIFPSAAFPSWCGLKLVMSDHKQPWIMTKRNTTSVSIYSISDLGVSSNLIGSLSRSNWALFTPYGVNNAWSQQNKMAGVNSRFAIISEAEILKMQDAVPENTKKAAKSVVEITEWVCTKTIIPFNLGEYSSRIFCRYLPRFQRIIVNYTTG